MFAFFPTPEGGGLPRFGSRFDGGTPTHYDARVPGSERNNKALAFLRIAVGVLFVIFAEYKVFGAGFIRGGGFQFWINRFLADGAYPFMVPVLRHFVLPHGAAIAVLVAYGELAIGLALVLGIFVRAASVFGLLYMLALLFSSNYPGPHAPLWQFFGASLDHSVLALCFLTFIFAGPDQAFSFARSFLQKRPGRRLPNEIRPKHIP